MKAQAMIRQLPIVLYLWAWGLGLPAQTARPAAGAAPALTEPSATNPGYMKGYEDGYPFGQQDVETRRSYDPSRHPAYAEGIEDARSELGLVSEYQESYRLGFEDGYQDGYDGFDPRATPEGPTPIRYRSAFVRGYQKGYSEGHGDARAARSYSFLYTRVYQKADLGYDLSRFPSREDYQYNFRTGYEAGYDDGYNNRLYSDRRDLPRMYTYRGRSEIGTTGYTHRRELADERYAAGAPIVIPEGTLLRWRLNHTLSTRSQQNGDPFTAQVVVPVYAQGALAIPAGSTLYGKVVRVIRPGRGEGHAELRLWLDKLVLPNDRVYRLNAAADREDPMAPHVGEEGPWPRLSSMGRKVGEIAIGTNLGILTEAGAGGSKGAAIGTGMGVILTWPGRDLHFPPGTDITLWWHGRLQLER